MEGIRTQHSLYLPFHQWEGRKLQKEEGGFLLSISSYFARWWEEEEGPGKKEEEGGKRQNSTPFFFYSVRPIRVRKWKKESRFLIYTTECTKGKETPEAERKIPRGGEERGASHIPSTYSFINAREERK